MDFTPHVSSESQDGAAVAEGVDRKGSAAAASRMPMRPWEPQRFEFVGKLMDAARNSGQVLLMYDHADGRHVAAKRIPNEWICHSPEEFAAKRPGETERPWTDIATVAALSQSAFPYVCRLVGLYRDPMATYVVSELALEGDLFSFCSSPEGIDDPPGLRREVQMLPIIMQLCDCVRRLHDMGVVHGDLSLENVLLTRCGQNDDLAVRVIDFGMSSTHRIRTESVGKPSYQAPEMHDGVEYDGFQADAFALGVIVYALLMKDFPWVSTLPGGCRCFAALQRLGFRRFAAKRGVRGMSGKKAIECLSEPMVCLLEGLLAPDPRDRLGLELDCGGSRSVWSEPVLQYAMMQQRMLGAPAASLTADRAAWAAPEGRLEGRRRACKVGGA